MADKRNIKKIVKRLICIDKIKMASLSDEEKRELKERIRLAILQMQKSDA